jgi:hypothetical protein
MLAHDGTLYCGGRAAEALRHPACPKGLNPAKAIAEIRKLMVKRVGELGLGT